MRCCSYNFGLIVLVMFENFAKLDSPRRPVQFWQNFQTSLIPLIPNCTRNRMITYTYGIIKNIVWKCPSKIITFRSLKNSDLEKLHQDLLNSSWRIMVRFKDIDDKYDCEVAFLKL